MTTIGKYCKAYPIKRLREYSQWTESAELKPLFTDNDILYLHENYVVTDGIFMDERIVFDQVTSEWQNFCRTILAFEVPVCEAVS